MAAAVLLSLYLSYRLSRRCSAIGILTASAGGAGRRSPRRDAPVLSHDELGELAKASMPWPPSCGLSGMPHAKVLRAQRTMEATLTSTPDPVFVVQNWQHRLRNPAAEMLAREPEFCRRTPRAAPAAARGRSGVGRSLSATGYDRVVTLRVGREDTTFCRGILAVAMRSPVLAGGHPPAGRHEVPTPGRCQEQLVARSAMNSNRR